MDNEAVAIFEVGVDGLPHVVGHFMTSACDRSPFSTETPPEVIETFESEGLPFPRWHSAKGWWAKLKSFLRGDTITVYPGDSTFPRALDNYNTRIFAEINIDDKLVTDL